MLAGFRKRLTFANVCSFLALLIALGTGSAYAANTIFSKDIVNGEVKKADIATRAVTSAKVRDGGVQTIDIADDAISGGKIMDGAVSGAGLADNAVTGVKVAGNSLTTADLAGADVNGGGISVPAGYVPNGRCRQLDASVGGAAAGEAVVFSVKAPLQDGVMIYGQRVPSDGHVTFDVCNFSGATQAAINNMPVRLITFG
jgi:hypothetical protein